MGAALCFHLLFILNLFIVSVFSVSCIFIFGVGFCLSLSLFFLFGEESVEAGCHVISHPMDLRIKCPSILCLLRSDKNIVMSWRYD